MIDFRLPFGVLRLVEQRNQLLQGLLHIAPEALLGHHGLAQLRTVDVDMYNFGTHGKFGPVAGDPVVEPAAQSDDAVGVVHGGGAGVVTVHTLHTQKAGIVGGNAGDAH